MVCRGHRSVLRWMTCLVSLMPHLLPLNYFHDSPLQVCIWLELSLVGVSWPMCCCCSPVRSLWELTWCAWMFVCRLVADVGLRLFIGWDRVAARTVWLPLLCRINTYTHFTWFCFLSMYYDDRNGVCVDLAIGKCC